MKDKKISLMIINYLKEHLTEPLSLDEIALEMGYSKFHMLRKFREETGVTIHKYIQENRLEQACLQLVQTDKPILEIAFDANYQSQAAFTLAFKQKYQCTPYVFRLQSDARLLGNQKQYSSEGSHRSEWRMAA